jgi:hypothetical protein
MNGSTSNTNKSRHPKEIEFQNPDDFINSTYKDCSLIELQDALVEFTKSISDTKSKLSDLVPKNFVKFISCKSTMEQICDDYSKNKLVSINSKNLISNITSRFENLLSKYEINFNKATEENLIDEMTENAVLLNYKEILRSNIMNFHVFTDILAKFQEVFGKGKKMEEIRAEIIDFLSAMYEKIIDEDTSFDYACNLVDIYLSTLKLQNDFTYEEKRIKIINTILVNFKEFAHTKMKISDEYYSYLEKTLLKILNYLEDEQADDAIQYFFQIFYDILCKTNPKYCRIVFRNLEDFIKSAKLTARNLKDMRDYFSNLKIDLFNYFVSNADINECVQIFDIFLNSLDEKETKAAQSTLLRKTEKHLISSERRGVEYLKNQTEEIKLISPCLGSKESKNMKSLARGLKEKQNIEVQGVVNKFKSMFSALEKSENKIDDEVMILMEAAKIVDGTRKYSREILSECRDVIINNKVILYYLRTYLMSEAPELNEDETKRVKELSFQFDFLLNTVK